MSLLYKQDILFCMSLLLVVVQPFVELHCELVREEGQQWREVSWVCFLGFFWFFLAKVVFDLV